MPNLLLIVIVILIAFFLLFQFIKKRKTEQVEENIEVDDKTYTLEKMTAFVKSRLDEITKINLYDIGLSEEELKRRKQKKYELKKALKGCTYGDVNDKKPATEYVSVSPVLFIRSAFIFTSFSLKPPSTNVIVMLTISFNCTRQI